MRPVSAAVAAAKGAEEEADSFLQHEAATLRRAQENRATKARLGRSDRAAALRRRP